MAWFVPARDLIRGVPPDASPASGFTCVLRVVCLGLLSAFGAVAALTGPYSGWIVTWFHVPHTSHKGVART